MTNRESKHVRRQLTPAERSRVEEARKLIVNDEAEIRQQCRDLKRARAKGPAGSSLDHEVGD